MSRSNSGIAASTQKKRKKEGRFNLIDFLIVLLILLLLASVIYLFSPISWMRRLVAEETRNIYYTVEFQGVSEDLIDKIREDQIVVDSISKNTIGTVTAVDYNTKYTELQFVEQDGQVSGVLAEYPSQYNVIVTIYATAEYVEGSGYSVNNQRIAVGEKLSLRFPDYANEGFCIGLSLE
ncbi:MAG: DUF4330 family protein [Clostridia bacterium]|nr:DUF4330 family protein [Clostridia bacterium]